MSRRYFGTDGIRGRVGTTPITPDFVLRLGNAVGRVMARGARSTRIVIGKDTRISGYLFESALEAGLVAAGVNVTLLGPMPTPAIAYLTRTFRASAGVVISASHNPFHDNGIKFFGPDGQKLSDELELAIEAEIDRPIHCVDSAALGRVQRAEDAAGRYIEFCKAAVETRLDLHGMKIVLDCAHGATYHIAPKVFAELGAQVSSLGVAPDGLNINRDVGSTHPEQLRRAVLEQSADMGIAFDGDGDRVLFVDHQGELVDGDEILYILAQQQVLQRGYCDGVVGTLMSNLGLELALQELEVPFARAKVGDRYVNEVMKTRGWKLGGENSGHVICADANTTGDGIVAALRVLEALRFQGVTLAQAKSGMRKCPQILKNVPLQGAFDPANEGVVSAVAEVDAALAGRGRVLLRPSGTEPLVRVMVEGEDATEVESLCAQLSERVAQAMN